MAIVDAIVMELEQEACTTRRVLERVPEDKFAWKPHPKSFSLGQLAMHIAGAQKILAEMAAKDVHEIAMVPPTEPTSGKQLLQVMDDSTAGAKQILQNIDDAKLPGIWTLTRNGKTLLSIPRAAFIRSILMNHIIHHRGQLSVYLRLLNVPVPSIYGPSADENPFG
jgi:uncharacterized damage-inducible protein DinB